MNDNLLSGGSDDQAPAFDPNKDYLKELIGEGGKFHDADEKLALQKVAYGKLHADHFIATKNKAFDDLSAEYLRLREDHNKGLNVQELADQVAQRLASSERTQAKEEESIQPVFDPKQVDSRVVELLQQHELTKMQQANRQQVLDKLTERFGNNYQSSVKQQIDELGVSEELFNSLAKNNPKLLIKTLGLDQPVKQQDFQAPPRTALRSDTFAPQGAEKRTWSYYQKLKKDKPSQYLSPETQTQMARDYERLGKDFEDGDFSRY